MAGWPFYWIIEVKVSIPSTRMKQNRRVGSEWSQSISQQHLPATCQIFGRPSTLSKNLLCLFFGSRALSFSYKIGDIKRISFRISNFCIRSKHCRAFQIKERIEWSTYTVLANVIDKIVSQIASPNKMLAKRWSQKASKCDTAFRVWEFQEEKNILIRVHVNVDENKLFSKGFCIVHEIISPMLNEKENNENKIIWPDGFSRRGFFNFNLNTDEWEQNMAEKRVNKE